VAVDLLVSILASTPGGRLYKALVESNKAISITGTNRGMLEEGLVSFRAVVRKDALIDDARTTMLTTIDHLAAVPLTIDELQRARSDLLAQIEVVMNDSEQLAMALSECSAVGDWRLLFIRRDRIRATTIDDVRHAAGGYLKPVNRTVGMFIRVAAPARAEIPRAPDVASLVKDCKEDSSAALGEAFDPSPANIESRTLQRRAPIGH